MADQEEAKESKNDEQISETIGNLSNRKVAVITGASSGMGQATALEFADKGYDLVLAARREDLLKEVAAHAQEKGVRALAVAVDTADEKAVKKLADKARRAYGHIDIWLNNAGVYLTARFEDSPTEDIKRLMDVNFYGYVYGSRAALDQFRAQGYGTLINISSVNAAAPQPYVGIYSASKAAIRALDESIRMELRLEGLNKAINVCTVMPASIDTNLFQNAANYTGKEIQALEPVYDAAYAAKRIAGLAERPRREMIIGPAGRMMRQQNSHMPRMYEKRFAQFTDKNLLEDRPAEVTAGNLYKPIESNTGISGGWRTTRVRADKMNLALGAGLGVILAGAGAAYAFSRVRHNGHHR
jgi:short-subunit dehydrogenase